MTAKDDLRSIGISLSAVALLAGGVTAYFWENVRGYHRFQAYCETEAGLRVFHPVSRDQVWIANTARSAAIAASFDGVAFARYVDPSSGKQIDVHRTGKRADLSESYSHVDADRALIPTYGWRSRLGEPVANEFHLTRSGYELYDLQNGDLIARYYDFDFTLFNPDNTPLAAPSDRSCLDSMSTYREMQKAIK